MVRCRPESPVGNQMPEGERFIPKYSGKEAPIPRIENHGGDGILFVRSAGCVIKRIHPRFCLAATQTPRIQFLGHEDEVVFVGVKQRSEPLGVWVVGGVIARIFSPVNGLLQEWHELLSKA